MVRFQQASANQISRLRKLQKRKYRRELGLFIAEGYRTVQQILEHGHIEVVEVFATETHLEEFGDGHLPESTYTLTDKELRGVSDSETPQGILAVCGIPEPADIGSFMRRPGLILAIDRIQDPGNMGTIMRTAGWFGVDLLLVGEGSTDMWSPKVVRSTVGATGSLAYADCSLPSALDQFTQAGWRPALLDGNQGSFPIEDWDPGMRTILVVGNEAQGISSELADRYDRYRIDSAPGQSAAESLNASIAVGIALYVLSQKSVNKI
jgi:TrmH family RNA methyltransferase